MKLIHCADLHLDSGMHANLDSGRAAERRAELLHTFERMVEYAGAQDVRAILIAGDLFDTDAVSATTRNTVLHAMQSHPEIMFYYLRGNHDRDALFHGQARSLSNFKMFDEQWKMYEESGIQIYGMELNGLDLEKAPPLPELEPHRFHIVMLHGQETESTGAGGERINLKLLRGKGIDYLALGHVHAYKAEKLDAGGIYCYPGCLEGRGFDECGEHGFVLLDVDQETGQFTHTFVPFAFRTLYEIRVNVTGCMTTAEISDRMEQALREAGCTRTALVKVVLTGEQNVNCEKNFSYLQMRLRQAYYAAKISDETTLRVDSEAYRYDRSLKGEFIRQVFADDTLDEAERNRIIRCGLQALAGEEVC